MVSLHLLCATVRILLLVEVYMTFSDKW